MYFKQKFLFIDAGLLESGHISAFFEDYFRTVNVLTSSPNLVRIGEIGIFL